jgi:hypothetical protein
VLSNPALHRLLNVGNTWIHAPEKAPRVPAQATVSSVLKELVRQLAAAILDLICGLVTPRNSRAKLFIGRKVFKKLIPSSPEK